VSSNDPHDADSLVEERPQPRGNWARRHELGDITWRPPLRGFCVVREGACQPTSLLPSHYSAPSVLPTAAVYVPACVPAPSEPAPIVAAPAPAPAPTPTVPGPRIGTSPAPRTLVPFHEESSLWPYPRAPLDNRDDVVELDFADPGALSDVDAFERRRPNGRNGAKHSKKDRAREREEIERSWDVPGEGITPNLDPGLSPEILGKPSQTQALAHLAVELGGARGSAVALPSPQAQSGAGSSVKPSQPNSASALTKSPEPSSSAGGTVNDTSVRPATTNPSPRPSLSPMDPMVIRQHPPRRRCRPMAQ